ncbi:hypothetical protein SAMN05421837_102753 [Amycolatopsis pretoriensis]|uniref:5,10-methylene-tetrahydrofolate dehydrogenase n=1 Tax=Amycolatopsis pretoriensis TaxID=218821 RepID=A0A1H5QEK8_9PSEU|nr:UbiA family prenyltransferase [Amycolatopsis pretoriensis]SEF24525.1 hypothetical protein SAMN05421837_102753 [Amycolatopsis pretoriensis]
MTAQRAPEALVVGLLTDDGLPGQLARRIADGLPGRLARDLGEEKTWRVEHETQSLPLNDEGEIPMLALAEERRAEHGWDLLVLITDLPRRSGTAPIASDYNVDHGVAMVSLPALGALRLRGRASRLVIHLVRHLVAHRSAKEADPPQGLLDRLRELVAPTRHIHGRGSADEHLALVGVRGRVRLLAGMIRDNRPWRLVPNLAGATAAAAATAAYGIITTSFWKLAEALPTLRLAGITLLAIALMAGWLMVHNHLWDSPSGHLDRRKAVLYNASTALTLSIGVACMYAILFVLALLASIVLIEGTYFGQTLGHPAGPASYLKLVWLATSVGIVAGAMGSNLEDEERVRRATYSRREQERQQRNREHADEADDAD